MAFNACLPGAVITYLTSYVLAARELSLLYPQHIGSGHSEPFRSQDMSCELLGAEGKEVGELGNVTIRVTLRLMRELVPPRLHTQCTPLSSEYLVPGPDPFFGKKDRRHSPCPRNAIL